MKSLFIISGIALAIGFAGKNPAPKAFEIYDKNGKVAEWSDVIGYCQKNEVVLFGELHNNPIAHWMQLEMTKALFEKNKNLSLGAEMFESDQQIIMNEFLNGTISEKSFEAEMRLWTNYKTDYKPLVKFAFENKLPFVATNVPRRYAALVNKKGKDELMKIDAQGKNYLCPLPLDVDTSLKSYQSMLAMDMGHQVSVNIVYAQALKDATMAHFIAQNLKKDGVFLHFEGAFHSDIYEGINYYLKKYKPGVKIATISTVQQKETNELEADNKGKADFIIVVDEDMTTTH